MKLIEMLDELLDWIIDWFGPIALTVLIVGSVIAAWIWVVTP